MVIYGSRYGTAAEIAQEITGIIEKEGNEVDLKDVKRVKKLDVSPYDLIVVGSGIKMGKWTKEALNFLKNNRKVLKDKKVALFCSCHAANEENSRKMGWDNYLKKVATENLESEPVDMGLFGSKFDPDANHGLMYKMTLRFWKKDLADKGIDTSKPYDFRNWDEIRDWARNLTNDR